MEQKGKHDIVHVFWWIYVHNYQEQNCGVLGCLFSFRRYCHSFPKCLYQFTLLLIGQESFSFSIFFPVLMIISLCCYNHSGGCVVVLICISPVTNEIKIFLYAYCLLNFFFCKRKKKEFLLLHSGYSDLLPIFLSRGLSLANMQEGFFNIYFEFESFIGYLYGKYLLLCTWLFILLMGPDTKFNVVPLIPFSLVLVTFEYSRKLCLPQSHEDIFL